MFAAGGSHLTRRLFVSMLLAPLAKNMHRGECSEISYLHALELVNPN
jgi:hypothetical protein